MRKYRHSPRGTDVKEGNYGHIINRVLYQDTENRKTNLATAASKGSLTSRKMTMRKTIMNNTEMDQGNVEAATPLGTKRPKTKERLQLSQFIAIFNTLVATGMPEDTDGTGNRGNVLLKK